MATVSVAVTPGAVPGNPSTYVYTITDEASNTLTVTASATTVSIATPGSAVQRDAQNLLVTLMLLLASGKKPRTFSNGSFFDYS